MLLQALVAYTIGSAARPGRDTPEQASVRAAEVGAAFSGVDAAQFPLTARAAGHISDGGDVPFEHGLDLLLAGAKAC